MTAAPTLGRFSINWRTESVAPATDGLWTPYQPAADRIAQLEADNASLIDTQIRNNETIERLIKEVASLKAALKDAQAEADRYASEIDAMRG